jgi:hypothetical protein
LFEQIYNIPLVAGQGFGSGRSGTGLGDDTSDVRNVPVRNLQLVFWGKTKGLGG